MTSAILETKRVILRRFEESDAPAFGVAMRDSNITETTMFGPPARTAEEGTAQALERIADFSAHWHRHGFGIFGAFDKNTEAMIGYCGLRHLDEFDGDLHISTMVDRPYWLGGLAMEIFRRNLEHAFLDLDFAVVYGTARTIQMASVHGMEKCGFSRLPDRKLRDWPVYYYECRREAFLARHVLHLNQRIADMDPDFQPQPAPASANDGRLATQV